MKKNKSIDELAGKACLPCRGGTPALKGPALRKKLAELGGGWEVIKGHHLEKEFELENFVEALALTNQIGALAEKLNHHPDIHLAWGAVRVTIWTHKIDGLTESDFVLAAGIEKLSK
jgi:4a-hydroxytetrahydrobiopterin dehydratase